MDNNYNKDTQLTTIIAIPANAEVGSGTHYGTSLEAALDNAVTTIYAVAPAITGLTWTA